MIRLVVLSLEFHKQRNNVLKSAVLTLMNFLPGPLKASLLRCSYAVASIVARAVYPNSAWRGGRHVDAVNYGSVELPSQKLSDDALSISHDGTPASYSCQVRTFYSGVSSRSGLPGPILRGMAAGDKHDRFVALLLIELSNL